MKYKEADYNTFVELGNYYAKDKNFGYWRGEKIEGSDGKSFDILSKEMLNSYDEYAKDKKT
ncbi:MAG: DKNYY domain-containing protein [Leptotrichia hongkongensis]